MTVAFPIFGARDRSLRSLTLHHATGGRVASTGHGRTVITALDQVSLALQPGDRLGVVGHNGSGKSTLLRVIAGIYCPTSGTVAVEGTVASLLDIQLGLDPDATGYENIFLRAYLLGYSKQDVAQRAEAIVAFSGLGDFIDLPIRSYSAGMSMRLGFSIATAFDADIILMDEWLAVGDTEFSQKSTQRLQTLAKESQILVLASHDEALVRSTCNCILRLHQGCGVLTRLPLPPH